MEENTLRIEIPLLLPTVASDQDGCLTRLTEALESKRGILQSHLIRDQGPVLLCVHFDPQLATLEDVRRMASRAGAGISNRFHHLALTVEGMDCSDCVTVIEHSLARLEGVLTVHASYAMQSVNIEYDSRLTSRRTVERRLRQLGYPAAPGGVGSWYEENKKLLATLLTGLFLLAGWSGEHFFQLPQPATLLFYAAAYLLGGFDIARHALGALRERSFNTDFLMLVAALGAAALQEFAEGAFLLFLFSLGHALEHRTLERARKAIRSMAEYTPRTALVRRGEREIEVPVESLAVGETVIVKPGVRVPLDGKVMAGRSGVDQSPITGESLPVERQAGDQVFAGSINGEGALDIEVSRLSKDSTLARVMTMVEQAQMHKSSIQRASDRFSRFFVPAILTVDLGMLVIMPLLGIPFREALFRALTVLVAASPCALALGTPAAVLAGIAQAARNGVLVKGGGHLENLGRLGAIAFDKTGTLTMGESKVTDLITFDTWSEEELLAPAAALESRSSHPLAGAVVQAAEQRGMQIRDVQAVRSHPGLGMQGMVDGSEVWLGSLRFFTDLQVEVPEPVRRSVKDLEAAGRTSILVRRGNEFVGQLGVADVLRPDAGPTVQALKRLGVRKTIMLTGDNHGVAGEVARQVGLDLVRADLLPEAKLEAIGELISEHGAVAMVGDGVNDAPALARATVGIAMGGAKSDAALETADVVLMGDQVSKSVLAVGLGKATLGIIRQNLAISIGVMTVLVVLAMAGTASMGAAILLHEGSTLVVILNALRLLAYRPAAI